MKKNLFSMLVVLVLLFSAKVEAYYPVQPMDLLNNINNKGYNFQSSLSKNQPPNRMPAYFCSSLDYPQFTLMFVANATSKYTFDAYMQVNVKYAERNGYVADAVLVRAVDIYNNAIRNEMGGIFFREIAYREVINYKNAVMQGQNPKPLVINTREVDGGVFYSQVTFQTRQNDVLIKIGNFYYAND